MTTKHPHPADTGPADTGPTSTGPAPMPPGPALRETHLRGLGPVHRGKVRDSYVVGDQRYLIATDRVSAFDVVFEECIPHKGRVLNQLTVYFTELARGIVPVAYESSPHPCVIVARQCPVYPLEVVVRGYLSGSAWQAYSQGERVLSGVRLKDGLTQNGPIYPPIITPTTKAEQGHDLPISRAELLERGLATADEWSEIERMARALFAQGTEVAASRGLILLDTKYEFGRGPAGPVLIDEVHTPDSSRYVRRASYEADPTHPEPLSKEFLRDWLRAQGFTGQAGVPIPHLGGEIVAALSARYVELCRELTGREPDLTAPADGDLEAELAGALRSSGAPLAAGQARS